MRTLIFSGVIILTLTTVYGQDNDPSRIFGGTKKNDFNKTLIELNNDGTGKYLCWLGEHGWAWREAYKFQWTVKNDSIKIKIQGDSNDSFIGLLKKDKILTKNKGPFSIQDKYVLITKDKEKAKEKLKEGQ